MSQMTTGDRLRQVALAHPGVPLRVVRKTNRHPESRGGSWGWYEVHPVGVTIGYWSDGDGTDDMRNIDAAAILATKENA